MIKPALRESGIGFVTRLQKLWNSLPFPLFARKMYKVYSVHSYFGYLSSLPPLSIRTSYVQGSTNRRALGLVNFVPALAYHFSLNLPAAFTQPRARLLVEPCIIPKFGVKMAIFGSLDISQNQTVQGSTNRRAPGCENAAGKLRQK